MLHIDLQNHLSMSNMLSHMENISSIIYFTMFHLGKLLNISFYRSIILILLKKYI